MTITWEEYEKALKYHDWTSGMSDSYTVYKKGEEKMGSIMTMYKTLSKENKEKAKELFDKYRKIGWGES